MPLLLLIHFGVLFIDSLLFNLSTTHTQKLTILQTQQSFSCTYPYIASIAVPHSRVTPNSVCPDVHIINCRLFISRVLMGLLMTRTATHWALVIWYAVRPGRQPSTLVTKANIIMSERASACQRANSHRRHYQQHRQQTAEDRVRQQ